MSGATSVGEHMPWQRETTNPADRFAQFPVTMPIRRHHACIDPKGTKFSIRHKSSFC